MDSSFELLREIVACSEIKQWFALEGILDIQDAEAVEAVSPNV